MNTSPSLFPFDAQIQPASIPTGPGPVSGDDAFAEQLSAALAATMLETTIPVQHQAAPSGVEPGIHVVGVPQSAGEPAGRPALEQEGKPIAGAAALSAPLDAGSIERSATSEVHTDDSMPGQVVEPGRRRADIVSPGNRGLTSQAAIDLTNAGLVLHASDGPSHQPVTVEAVRPAGPRDITVPGSSGPALEPAAGSSTPLQDTPTAAAPGPHRSAEPIPALQAPSLSQAGLSEMALEGYRPDEAISSRPHLSDPMARRDERSASYPAGQGSAINHPNLVETALVRNTEAMAGIVGTRSTLISERLQPSQLQNEAPARLAEVHARGDHGQMTAGRPDISPIALRAPGDRRSEAAAATPMKPLTTQGTNVAAEPGHATVRAIAEGHLSKSSVFAIENRAPSAPVVTPADKAAQAAVGEVGLIQGTASDGVERFQPVSSLEGLARDVERLDSTSSIASPRSQTSTAHPSAGTQVALQIVRALPDGVDRLSVHLQPADLGSVDIQLTFDGTGRLTAVIAAERPETLELLQRDARFLERSLGDSGLKLSSDGLSFSLKQDQQQGQNFQQQAHTREAAFHTGRAYDHASDMESALPTRQIDGLRLLDIRT